MLRTISRRLIASSLSRPVAVRPISTTGVRYIKIKHADGTKTSPPSPSDAQSPLPSPAERPSSPPPEKTTPPPPSDPVISTPPSSSTSTAPSAPAAEPIAPEEPVEELKDFSKLPSLDVDSELARLAQPEKEDDKSKAGSAGPGGAKRRTGAGRKEYVSSIEKQRRAMLRYGIGALVVGGVAAALFGGEAEVAKEGEPKVGTIERLKNNANEFFDVSE